MAAYEALVSAARTLDECVINDIVPLDHGEEASFKSLHQFCISLQAFLENFGGEAEKLEGTIRDAAYLVEDLVEDFMLKQYGACQESSHFSDLSQELQKVIQVVHSIQEEVVNTKNNINTKVEDPMKINDYSSSREVPAPPTGKDVMVGFDDQLMEIKSKLYGESFKELKVISIFGMGGIGKTTLTRNAFDDRLTKQRFDRRGWVTVSQAYSVRDIFISLLVSFNVLSNNTSNASVKWLKECLYKTLKGMRYLIVLDDIWSMEAWDEVMMVLPEDENGSRVLLTTRMLEVADYAADGSSSVHSMRFLDADQSWNLLQHKLMISSSTEESNILSPTLEGVGKEIAKRCGGLPLTVVVVAGILQNITRTEAAWKEIAQKVSVAESRDDRVANVLSLSYKHLPHHLRPCFLYMSGFKEDYRIPVSDLFRLWTSEGFLKQFSTPRSKSLEETAGEYLEDLVRRSLILVVERDISGKIIACSIHDLLLDMCIRKSREEQFLQSVRHSNRIYEKQRRVSTDNTITYYPSTIRTILSSERIHNDGSMPDTFYVEANRLLRVIYAPDISFRKFPAVLHLFQLRYLHFTNLYDQQMPVLPEDIYKLKKLQTFVVSYGCLEFNIWRMPQLRHLEVGSLRLPYDVETTFTTLENLQSLSRVHNLVCTETIVRSMPNLKELMLVYAEMEEMMDFSEFQIENLVHLHQLESLNLYVDHEVKVFASLSALPTMLRKLCLCNCMLEWEKLGSICSSLSCLEELQLVARACYGEVWETEEGQFSHLKMLVFGGPDPQHWITESYHFPTLEHLLFIGRNNKALEIPDEIGEIPTLQLIEIRRGCSQSIVASAKRIQSEQQDMGNYDLRLKIHRDVHDENGAYRCAFIRLYFS